MTSIGALSTAQDPGKAVEYTTAAVPVRTALAGLSRRAGKKLEVSDELAKEPIVIRFHEVPVQQALDRIADVMSAEWVPVQQGLELERTSKVLGAIKTRLAERNLRNIQAALQREDVVLKQAPLDEDSAQDIARAYAKFMTDRVNNVATGNFFGPEGSLTNRTAGARLLAEMLLVLGPKKIASLPVGRHIFTFDPTAMQEPIEGLDKGVLVKYATERNLLARALARTAPKDSDGVIAGPLSGASTFANGTIRPLLSVQVPPDLEGGSAWLVVFSGDGAQLSVDSVSFNGFDSASWIGGYKKMLAGAKSRPVIRVSAITAELGRRADHTIVASGPLSQAALEFLCHPETHDPLSGVFSDGLIGIAEQANENLVATASDEGTQSLLRAVHPGGLDPGLFMYHLDRPILNKVAEEDGWLTCKPANPLTATALRTDRAALGKFMQALNNKGAVSLEDWAEMAQGVPYPDDGPIVTDHMTLWQGGPYNENRNDWDTLRLFGSLSDQQRQYLEQGGQLDTATLSADQQEILIRQLYAGGEEIVKSPSAPPGTPNLTPLAAESTEAAPAGIPPHALLSATEKVTNEFYINIADPHSAREEPYSLDDVARFLAQNAEQMPGTETIPKMLSLKYGSDRLITFYLAISDTAAMKTSLTERFMNANAIPVEKLADQLPPDVWNQLRKKIDEDRAAFRRNGSLPQPPQQPAPPPLAR